MTVAIISRARRIVNAIFVTVARASRPRYTRDFPFARFPVIIGSRETKRFFARSPFSRHTIKSL
jgi:hypothetical protein